MRLFLLALAIVAGSPCLAKDLPVIRFEPSAADKKAHYAAYDTDSKPFQFLVDAKPVKKSKATTEHHKPRIGLALRRAAYVAACGAQGYSRAYNQYQYQHPVYFVNTTGNSGNHSFTVMQNGNLVNINQTY